MSGARRPVRDLNNVEQYGPTQSAGEVGSRS